MTKLAERVAEMDQEVERGRSNHEHKVALDAYAEILNTSEPALDVIRTARRQQTVLKSQLTVEEDPVSAQEQLERRQTALACLNELETAWRESDYKVKQSGEFARFTTAVKNYGRSLEQHNKKMFRSWVEETDAQVSVPEAILDLQRKVPELSDLADKYERAYNRFKDRSQSPPASAREAQELLVACEAIKASTDGMVLDLPEPVKQFFDSLKSASAADGAPLKLLNDIVLKWLDENGQTENYVIRRKGRSSW